MFDKEIKQLNDFILENNRYPSKIELNKDSALPYQNKCLKLFGRHENWINFGIAVPLTEKLKKTCINCQNLFDHKENTFCSHSCAAIFNNLKRNKRKCLFCCKTLNHSVAKKYCSRECDDQHHLWVKIDGWLIDGKTSASNRLLRKMLSLLFGYKCSNTFCGLSDWHSQKITLEVDHINGNHEDSSINNIRLLCPNCHTLTPTYKNKNKGNGRHSRRQRYQDGKSY